MFDRELESRLVFEDTVSRPPYEFDVTIHSEDSAWPNCYRDYHVHVGFDCWVESRKQLLGGQVIKESETVINSFAAFRSAISTIWALWCEHKYIRLRWSTSKNRTLDQNALWAAMYQRISQVMGDGSANYAHEVKSECKLLYGVPILLSESERFKAGWERYFAKESYQTQLFLMGPNPLFGKDGFPVTRLLDTKTGAEYTDTLAKVYSQNGVNFSDLIKN